MNVLILSCGTGGGHNSACFAMEQALTRRGHSVKILNPYTLKSSELAETVNQAYVSLVQKLPSAFGAVYHIGDVYRKLPGPSPVYRINRRMAPFLGEYMAAESFDAVLCTHLFPAEILTCMKKSGTDVPPVYFIATDYVCIPFTEETDCDHYIIPAEDLKEDFCRRGIPEDRICPLGIPVDARYSENGSRATLRETLGFAPDTKYILLAGGSVGAGHIDQMVSLLTERYAGERVKLIVVSGNNRSLYEKLSDRAGENCILLEFTEHMAEYMKACDLFISKPGGLSSTEAAVSGTPLIHIAPIPGCETFNMEYFQRRGMSIKVDQPRTQLIGACDMLLETEAGERMREKQRAALPPRASDAICSLLEQNAREKAGQAAG